MATPSAEPSVAEQQFSDPVDYSENEDEVDQLDSDSEPQDNVVNLDASSTSSQKDGSGNDGVRQPGHSLLPVVRLENIIQAEGVLSEQCPPSAQTSFCAQVSPEICQCQKRPCSFCQLQRCAVFCRHALKISAHISKEEFIKRMALAGHNHAATDRRNVVDYRDMGKLIHCFFVTQARIS
jgi:hypothetical protein